MLLRPMMKKLIICASNLLLGCSASPPLACHEWTPAEKATHYKDDKALPPTSSLHPLIRDYERLCINLK